MTDIRAQIDAAFSYRGHITAVLKSGETVEGYLFNRQRGGDFVELILKNSDERRKLSVADLEKIEFSGKDHAETYEQFMKRTGGKS